MSSTKHSLARTRRPFRHNGWSQGLGSFFIGVQPMALRMSRARRTDPIVADYCMIWRRERDHALRLTTNQSRASKSHRERLASTPGLIEHCRGEPPKTYSGTASASIAIPRASKSATNNSLDVVVPVRTVGRCATCDGSDTGLLEGKGHPVARQHRPHGHGGASKRR